MTKIDARNAWFTIHKWIGIILVIAIIPLSLSGAALVWHDALDEAINPQRYATTAGPALSPDAYAAAARATLAPGERIASLRFGEEAGDPIVVSAAKPAAGGDRAGSGREGAGRRQGAAAARGGPPVRTQVWLDPGSGRVLDQASSNAGLVRFLHGLHGSLQVPVWGRTIVGWIGVAMFFSCISGLWLWWPTIGRWTRGLRWRRQNNINANLHHQLGFWIALPLAVLSLTGVWISFPAFFAALSGGGGQGGQGGPGGFRGRATPVAETRMIPSQAVAAARTIGRGNPVAITWPTDREPTWQVSFPGEPRPTSIAVDDETGEAFKARGGGFGGQGGVARLMRRIHDGTDMGIVWQIVIFVGGIIPAILGVTGIIMWLRTRGWRAEVKRKKKARLAAAE